ncbi:MAG: methenyltetrahydrofolate cyclohydrolase [Candidatus Chloroheliales bacterium]|nr:MAG: methenyltetrahydrofolate cyclohydrolase [Chloroflexota bacterium]
MLQDLTVSAFLDELASASPAPGGGSVAALAGAMAAGLVSMVCNLTLGNDKYREAEAVVRETLAQAEQLRARLTRLMEEDTNAYSAVIASYKLPKDSDEQKAARSAAIQAALKQAVEVPLATAEAAAPLRTLARTAKRHGNPNAASDAYVAEILATTAIDAALANANINLPSVKDAEFVAASRVRIAALQEL